MQDGKEMLDASCLSEKLAPSSDEGTLRCFRCAVLALLRILPRRRAAGARVASLSTTWTMPRAPLSPPPVFAISTWSLKAIRPRCGRARSPAWPATFSGIETHCQRQPGGPCRLQGHGSSAFVLEAEGTAPIPRAEFFCGVFGSNGQTGDSAVFSLEQSPARQIWGCHSGRTAPPRAHTRFR